MCPLYDYVCTICGTEQEKQHKIAEKNEEPCTNCQATPDKLKKNLSPIRPHLSWKAWNQN